MADAPIVRDFSGSLQTGTITTLIGGNGAGKLDPAARDLRHQPLLLCAQIVFKGETIERLPPVVAASAVRRLCAARALQLPAHERGREPQDGLLHLAGQQA